jgi:hypothetical protein
MSRLSENNNYRNSVGAVNMDTKKTWRIFLQELSVNAVCLRQANEMDRFKKTHAPELMFAKRNDAF